MSRCLPRGVGSVGLVFVALLAGAADSGSRAWAGEVTATTEAFRTDQLRERQPKAWDGFLVVPRDLDEGAQLRVSYWRIAGRRPDRGRVAVEIEVQRDLDGNGTLDAAEEATLAGRVEDHAFEGTIAPLARLRAGDLVLFSARLTQMPPLAPFRRAVLEVALLDSASPCPGPDGLAGELTPPRRIFSPSPQYTEAARKERISGQLQVEALLDCEGRATRLRLVSSLDPGLDQRSFEALSKWRYAPARLDGRPVKVKILFTINFQIQAAARPKGALEAAVTVEGRLIDPGPPPPPR